MLSWTSLVWYRCTSGHRSVLCECVKDNKRVFSQTLLNINEYLCIALTCKTEYHGAHAKNDFTVYHPGGERSGHCWCPTCAPLTLPWGNLLCGPQSQAYWWLPTTSTLLCPLPEGSPSLVSSQPCETSLFKKANTPWGTTGSSIRADGSHWVKAPGSLSFRGQLWDGSVKFLRGSWVDLSPKCPCSTCSLTHPS